MSNKIEIESLEDVKTLGDLESLLKKDLVYVVRSIQHILKQEKRDVTKADEVAEEFPFVAVSAVDNICYTLKFDPESKKARVVDSKEDSRGPHMAYYAANNILQSDIKKQTKRSK